MNRPDEILKEIANVIWEQIWASTEWNVVGSWGTYYGKKFDCKR